MEFTKVIENRYSCKKFKSEQIQEEQLSKILHAANTAPTAKNLQEYHIYAAQSTEGLAKIDQITPCRYNAPTVLVVTYDKDNVFTYPGEQVNSGAEDAAIVATHMMLAAYDAGVASCWINFFDPASAKSTLELPENEEVVMLLDLGYADESIKPLPNHFSRKNIEELVTKI